jgi:alpha-glucuronidase
MRRPWPTGGFSAAGGKYKIVKTRSTHDTCGRCIESTGCHTRYRTRHFFNNSNTDEDIATKFEQEYVLFFHISYTFRFKFRCNILINGKSIKEMSDSVASGTLCIIGKL